MDEGQEKRYDALCRQILSVKEILANILTSCVPEFRGKATTEVAKKYIEGTPDIGVPILETPIIPQISSGSSDFVSQEEGRTSYDVRFSAIAPDTEGKVQLFLNVEAQNKSNPGYPLLKRGTFYCGRMLSAQYGTVFTKSDYGSLRKVYSIWICPYPRTYEEYSITLYQMEGQSIEGNYVAKREEYDNIAIIMIYLGKKPAHELTGLMRLLTVLFLEQMPTKEVKEILEDEYKIHMTPDIEKGVEEMCNLSAGLIERGEERGFKRGEESGFKRGKEEMIVQMLKENLPIEQISRITKLPIAKLQEIQNTL